MMNVESSIHTADTLVVRDRSRQRRWLVVGAVGVVLACVVALLMFSRRGSGANSQAEAGKGAGQIPPVSVVIPGQTQTGRVITASGPLGAKRDQPVGIAGQGGRVIKVLVDAGTWVRAGQVLAVVDRSVQAQQAAQLAAQVESAKANAALAQSNYERAIALQGRRGRTDGNARSARAAGSCLRARRDAGERYPSWIASERRGFRVAGSSGDRSAIAAGAGADLYPLYF